MCAAPGATRIITSVLQVILNRLDFGMSMLEAVHARWAQLLISRIPDLREPGSFSMRGHSVGGFGSVTTNKLIATIVGEVFGKHVQAYPRYGSEKKGLPTTYFLTIADEDVGGRVGICAHEVARC